MRQRFSTLIVSLISLCLAQVPASLAWAQAETGHSTIRLTSATEAATDAQQPAFTGPAFSQQYSTSTDDPSPGPNSAATNNQTQGSPSPHSVRATNYSSPPIVEVQPKMHSRPLINPYATSAGQSAMSKMPRPMPVQSIPNAQQSRTRGKPFTAMQSEPTISPYMNLYRNDPSGQNQLLNYYTLVRPQLDQIDANKKQAADMQKLRNQVLNATQHPSQGQGATSDPSEDGMTVSAHYMDTAQFYRHRK
jgi:hypothetical protein